MLKIDDNLLQQIGLGSLPPEEKRGLLGHIYETLEMRVGMRLADQMTNEQLDEFEQYFEAKDDAGAFKWLETNFPNYKDIVNEEFEKLRSEVAQNAPQILAAAQANANAALQQPISAQQPVAQQYTPVQPSPQASYDPPAAPYQSPPQMQGPPPNPSYSQPQPQYQAPQPVMPPQQPAYDPISPQTPQPQQQPWQQPISQPQPYASQAQQPLSPTPPAEQPLNQFPQQPPQQPEPPFPSQQPPAGPPAAA